MGRRTKLTPELQERIVQFLRNGSYIETAAKAAGIGRRTLYDWLERGANARSGIYHDFHRAVELAQAEDEAFTVAQVERLSRAKVSMPCPHCKKGVDVPVPDRVALAAATWKLERKYPARYGGRLKVELEHQLTKRTQALLSRVKRHMSPSAFAELVQALRKEQSEL